MGFGNPPRLPSPNRLRQAIAQVEDLAAERDELKARLARIVALIESPYYKVNGEQLVAIAKGTDDRLHPPCQVCGSTGVHISSVHETYNAEQKRLQSFGVS